MADEVKAPDAESSGDKKETVPATEKPGVPPNFLEEFNTLKRQMNFLVAKKNKEAETESSPEATTQKERVEKLEKALKDQSEKAAKAARNLKIKTVIAEHGITGEDARDLEARLHYDYGAMIKDIEDDVVIEDDKTGQQFELKDFVGEKYLKGSAGDRYRRSAEGTTKGAKGLRPGAKQSTGTPLSDLPFEERIAEINRDPATRDAKMKQFYNEKFGKQ